MKYSVFTTRPTQSIPSSHNQQNNLFQASYCHLIQIRLKEEQCHINKPNYCNNSSVHVIKGPQVDLVRLDTEQVISSIPDRSTPSVAMDSVYDWKLQV